jgi:glucose-6-phosphate isomerase, archaeal
VTFDPGFPIAPVADPLGFRYGPGTFGPRPELRSLDAIRPSLRDPACTGPDPVYAIVMDVGKTVHRAELSERMLLVGVVTYAAGTLGREPVRSQGHVHKVSAHSGWRPPEVYEIWTGAAYVYMQEFAADDPGRCFAIHARAGEVVVVPPGWAHATVSADPGEQMTFGALCDREYGFEYEEVRKRRGLAWYPVVEAAGAIEWEPNPLYRRSELDIRAPRDYSDLGIARGVPLYTQLEEDFDRFRWVSEPALAVAVWAGFTP